MPRKPITWIGSLVILAAGGFCFLALLKYRNALGTVDTRSGLVTVALFLAIALAGVALFLWYYFNERR